MRRPRQEPESLERGQYRRYARVGYTAHQEEEWRWDGVSCEQTSALLKTSL